MSTIDTLIRGFSRLLAIVAAASIVAMVLAIAADVLVRNATGASLPGMIEVAETSLVVSVFFGLAWAAANGEHVAVTLLTDRFSAAWMRIVNIFVWTLSSAFLAWLLYASTVRAVDSTRMLEERFGIVRWPMYPMRWVLVVGLVALLLVAILNVLRSALGGNPMGTAGQAEAAAAQGGETAAPSQGIGRDSAESAGGETFAVRASNIRASNTERKHS